MRLPNSSMSVDAGFEIVNPSKQGLSFRRPDGLSHSERWL